MDQVRIYPIRQGQGKAITKREIWEFIKSQHQELADFMAELKRVDPGSKLVELYVDKDSDILR